MVGQDADDTTTTVTTRTTPRRRRPRPDRRRAHLGREGRHGRGRRRHRHRRRGQRRPRRGLRGGGPQGRRHRVGRRPRLRLHGGPQEHRPLRSLAERAIVRDVSVVDAPKSATGTSRTIRLRGQDARRGTIGRMSDSLSGRDLIAGPPPTLLPADPAAADLDAGVAPAEVVRRAPRVAARLGHPRRDRAGGRRGRRRDRLRLRAGRLPPQPRLPAPQRVEGPRAGAVGARAQPRLPARAGGADRGGRPASARTHERDRCDQFLYDSSPEAHAALLLTSLRPPVSRRG